MRENITCLMPYISENKLENKETVNDLHIISTVTVIKSSISTRNSHVPIYIMIMVMKFAYY